MLARLNLPVPAASVFLRSDPRYCLRLLCLLVAFSLTPPAGFAQGSLDPVLLMTGAGTPLTSQNLPLNLPTVTDDFIRFEFGFATNERFGPGQTFDSFTISVKSPSDVRALVVVTVDAGGNVFAPPSPGNFPVDADSIQREAVAFPSLEPVFAMQTAHMVSVPLPKELSGKPLEVVIDLFDNQDAVMSVGYYRSAILVVPEPRTWLLLLIGLVTLFTLRHTTRR